MPFISSCRLKASPLMDADFPRDNVPPWSGSVWMPFWKSWNNPLARWWVYKQHRLKPRYVHHSPSYSNSAEECICLLVAITDKSSRAAKESLYDGCTGARATFRRCKHQLRRQMSWWPTAKMTEWLLSWATCFNILFPTSFHLSSLYPPFPTFPLCPLSFLFFTLLLLHLPFQFLGVSPPSYFLLAICLRFEEASWWSPTPEKATLACMCVSAPTWLGRKTAILPSWRCLVSHRSDNTRVLYEKWFSSVQEQFTVSQPSPEKTGVKVHVKKHNEQLYVLNSSCSQ